MEIASSATQDGFILGDLEFARAEQVLNVAGYIPIISHYSGMARSLMGALQIVVGIAEVFFHRIRNSSRETQENSLSSNSLVCHGAANYIRGTFETQWGLVANVSTLLYDFSGVRYFYQAEVKSPIWK